MRAARGIEARASFSDDLLRLEVSGPEEQHFSVVDVPGIFRKTTDGVTTNSDRQMVEKSCAAIWRIRRPSCSPCNVDIATQEILTMAEEADEEDYRTLGVLTKPDLVNEDAEGPVIDLIEGNRHKLNLG